MPTLASGRTALSISVGALLLSACGAVPPMSSNGQGDALPSAVKSKSVGLPANAKKQEFDYTGKEQKFVVPSGVTELRVVADGAIGGGVSYPSDYDEVPGLGGRVSAVIAVRPGETLSVFVGGAPAQSTLGQGGFNGGGNGAWGGGGASDLRQHGDKLSDRVLVAGGGGAAGGAGIYLYSGQGGGGGGTTGGSGSAGDGRKLAGQGGTGGTQRDGGTGGAGGQSSKETKGSPGAAGALGTGGAGGQGGPGPGRGGFSGGSGGGGGGGYYGGAGGGGGAGHHYGEPPGAGGGGGGGSSYVEPNAEHPIVTQGVWKHNGVVTLYW